MAIDYKKILPVLLMEYLSISITRTLFPLMIVNWFGKYSYLAVGVIETIKGILAFFSSPLFGKLSDRIGRKYCLLVTVIGTTLPVGLMAFTENMWIYCILMSISGFFSATFALTFAYISDCVTDKKKRAPAYGLALATYGLSFCFGPITGSYIAEEYSRRSVFILSLLLILLNAIYIIFLLPESVKSVNTSQPYSQKIGLAMEYIPSSWNLKETFRIFSSDEFMKNLAVIVLTYYTAVWAVVSTLMVYITRHLTFSTVSLGWLLSGYGFATIISEAVLVRIIVPQLGELNSIRLGLVSFSIQCVLIAMSTSPRWIFFSVIFSTFANLVYPSISSLVSKIVQEDMQGEALGALNGIRAVTEGFGPLLFGLLMALFEDTQFPGAPYLVTSLVSLWSFLHCFELPADPELVYHKHLFQSNGIEEADSLISTENSSLTSPLATRKILFNMNGELITK